MIHSIICSIDRTHVLVNIAVEIHLKEEIVGSDSRKIKVQVEEWAEVRMG